MPLCTSCAHPADYLYTTYSSPSNIRLSVCARCGNFLDPLIEHPPLLLLLDLVLLKPRVYLHLLFNRGAAPKDGISQRDGTDQSSRDRSDPLVAEWSRLLLAVVFVETATRLLSSASAVGESIHASLVVKTSVRVLVETSAQHLATTVLALVAIRCRDWFCSRDSTQAEQSAQVTLDGRRKYFRPIMISLTLLYATVTPVALQLLLGVWQDAGTSASPASSTQLPDSLVELVNSAPAWVFTTLDEVLEVWNRSDRTWAGARLLGGMSAGFGLRVILPTHPIETTAIVLAGWGAAEVAGRTFQRLFD